MRNNALYFPYINIPENNWLYLMLLYWDQLSSIAPSAAFYDRRQLMPHMSTLMKEGLVNFIEPKEFIEEKDDFGESFIQIVKRRLASRRSSSISSVYGNNINQRIPIHIEKLGPVADELVYMHLATHADYPWYEMDKWVAEAFMAYLATFLGSLPEVNSTPITNNETCFHLVGGYPRKTKDRTIQRYEILSNILPFPRDELKLGKIIEFKEKHLKELSIFRDHIEGLSIDLSNIRDRADRAERRELAIRELRREIDSIASHIGETWHEIVFLDIVPILSAGGSVITGIQTNEPITTGLGATSLSAAMYQSIERRRNNRQILHNHPLAYGALLKRELPRLREGGRR